MGKNEVFWYALSEKSKNYWTIDMDVNSVSMRSFDGTKKDISSIAVGVVLDTGTSFIVVPRLDFKTIIETIEYDVDVQLERISSKTEMM